jgi:hypothetical protein
VETTLENVTNTRNDAQRTPAKDEETGLMKKGGVKYTMEAAR